MRMSRAYQMPKEFRERQGAFDFATVALAVLDMAIETKKRLTEMAKAFSKGLKAWRPAETVKKARQLVLELDSIAQIPLFTERLA